MSEEKKKEKEDDPRLEIVRSFILKSHRLKLDRWQKLMGNDEYRTIINNWLKTPSIKQLVISNTMGNLAASYSAPPMHKQKISYFAKKGEIELTVDNVRKSLLIGELSPKPIDDLAIMIDNLYYPLLTNPLNQKGWTETLSKDMEMHLQELRNTIAEVRGNINNKTLLPMPISIDKVMQIQTEIALGHTDIVDMKMKNSLEGIVIKWATQLDTVLKEDSSSLFDNNKQPSPLEEISFWQGRLKNLENIYEQLTDPRVKAIGIVLQSIESAYFTSFSQTFKNVVAALHEARDITLWLKPLEKYFDDFEIIDFLDLYGTIIPMLHCICLVWANSRYYCKNSRMVVLFKSVHNMLISSASRILDPEALFEGEPYEILAKVEKVVAMLEHYREQYHIHKAKLKEYEVPNSTPIYWSFRPKHIFERFDLYLIRLSHVRQILMTADDFIKLERVEIGGLKGRTISRKIQEIYLDFSDKIFKSWRELKFDPLDVDPRHKHFERALKAYTEKTDVLEMKLALQFREAFEDCSNLDQLIKLVHVLGTLLIRPIISQQVGKHLLSLIYLFNNDLDIAKECFDQGLIKYETEGLSAVPVDDAFPPVAGTLMWLHKLRGRVTRPVTEMSMLDFPIFDNDQGRYILSRKDEMLDLLNNFEEKVFGEWTKNVPQIISTGMSEHLIIRDDKKLIHMNFIQPLSDVLTEVKYLKSIDKDGISDKALSLFELSDHLYNTRLSIFRVVEWYNQIRLETNKVEFDIIEAEINELDGFMEKAISSQTWKDYDDEYVSELYSKVKDLNKRVNKSHKNIKSIQENIRKFGGQPLYERKDSKSLILLEDREQRLIRYAKNCEATRELIKKVMDENFCLLFNHPLLDETPSEVSETVSGKSEVKSQESEAIEKKEEEKEEEKEAPKESVPSLIVEQDSQTGPSLMEISEEEVKEIVRSETELKLYRPYEEYVDELIGNEVMDAIKISVQYIKYEMENRHERNVPLFEVKMDLQLDKVVFFPALEMNYKKYSLLGLIEDLLMDIYAMSDEINKIVQPEEERLDAKGVPSLETFVVRLRNETEIDEMKLDIIVNTRQTCREALEYFKYYEIYSYIWLEDKQLFLERFLKYGRALTPEEIESLDDPESTLKEEKEISLAMFKKQIDFYYKLYDKVMEMEQSHVFRMWLLVDMKGFKWGLLNEISHWNNMFKEHLSNQVKSKLQELQDFIESTNKVFQLTPTLERDDFSSFLKILEALTQIRNQEVATDNMFEPLKDIVSLLGEYNVEFDEKIHNQFAELPELWTRLKKSAVQIKQDIGPIQEYQVGLIHKRIQLFNFRMTIYRDMFKKLKIFHVPCEDAYKIFDKTRAELDDKQSQYNELITSANLFELPKPEEKLLNLCDHELKLSKQIWDFVYTVESCIENWKTTPWKKVNVEDLEQECKRFAKELRQLHKDIRGWEPYVFVTDLITNLLASLKAIMALQNPAIRDRHWTELMRTTQVRFNMDSKTTLADLLNLNLHKYEEEVKNIVDKSVKEEAMEKAIKALAATWRSVDFEYDIHERTNLKMLKVSEEIIETLEENLSQLQTLLASKYIAFFFTEIQDWQDKLSNTDQVLDSFFEVQRKWMYLESIFIGSEDIRNQLPEDSKRFDRIDREFKEILNKMVSDMNVVKATNHPQLYERLEGLQKDLIQCEKALNDYLETKRLAYPRFYFISSADLLDILANGNNPELVARHLTKLYDSLAKLVFLSKGNKTAKGMIAKENEEYVEFHGKCDCSGKVENWLNRVTEIMRITLHRLFDFAVKAYVEKERDQWLFDWPAQPALCTTQIWWTIEVNQAFNKLEEGYDKAMKEYLDKHIKQLKALIILLVGELTKGDRQKIMTICTIDVHARDVVAKMIEQKVESSSAFQWQSQLRHRWDEGLSDCYANICDAQFRYDYEYLGNTPRLVITPLTDRCYITLTQSLHLIMGGAPAGPAGTGKTETTKDLGRALGIMVYVFNCSEQMDYKSCGNIYKGLAQTGAWGCFDEFNRISVEVLSVVAVQVKSIQDAIKAKKKNFNFMGEQINLIPTVGIFITMNPGYAGRTELPENLKALFRPCAMVVPDFELICEIMLVAEGFQEARMLARKFITLYTLCKELLSKQDHYDWGLRAIKSVLVVAGSLKRADKPDTPEDHVLMRALRDFNLPKIVTEDVPVFRGLIGDLFPNIEARRQPDIEFEKLIAKSAVEIGLQKEKGFVLKVVQLQELFEVRHSVFIIGNAGTGKSAVWQTLNKTYQNQKGTLKPYYDDLDPKAVTNDELFGIINPATREWKDGLLSVIMRNQANMTGKGWKWVVLDGDIDPMWIESLNTVMDDNKVLTLASNERIALTRDMRLLFEISNLRTATPATVSRAGILYINPQDLGWNPFVASWIEKRESKVEKGILPVLFEKYVLPLLEHNHKFKRITPISEIAQLQMTCFLLECLLTPENVPAGCPKEWYEIYFCFSIIWGFGSALFHDQMTDWRNEFHKWWMNEFKTVKFPPHGTIFNYYVDKETKHFLPWDNLMEGFELDAEVPLQQTLVPTADTTRLRWFMDQLIERKHPVMLIGAAGSGKSVIVQDKLNSLSDRYVVTNVPFNFYTTSEMLQKILEKPLEKQGRQFGPPKNKFMIYFVDDLNMPEVDTYGTVQPHTLIRQFLNYSHWYDRIKLTLKEIKDCQFVSCMNPTAGSFTIDSRLQRHFCAFAVNFPSGEPLFHIYNSILSQHLASTPIPPLKPFSNAAQKICSQIVQTAITLHNRVVLSFLPTATKFHYIFNLRDLSNTFQGILSTGGDAAPDSTGLIRLWMHEATRVYCDKLTSIEDIDSFHKIMTEVVKKGFEELNENKVFQRPLTFWHFADGLADSKYMPVRDDEHLKKLMNEAQQNFNDEVGDMNLVLFEDAIGHICRINRILDAPRGNALLIGVGGSGKQSLSRLAAFISTLEVFQIQLRKGYSINDLKTDIAGIYMKTGVRNIGYMFLMTDAQVAEENFLVLINDMLASGEISELFPDDEVDNIVNALRNEVKQMGIMDTKENVWKFFIDRVRRNLKIVLCFSPVGSTLRIRSRKFPAIVNCTAIDWFHEWPKNALESVSQSFLQQVEILPPELIKPIAVYMSYVHNTVNEMSSIYFQNEKRYNYTTPKSFLELIALYLKLLIEKDNVLKERIVRLENGVQKLRECAIQVDSLQDQLAEQEVVLRVKNAAADELIVKVKHENDIVEGEKNGAAEEEKKVRIIEEEVTAKAKGCEEDLKKAEPALRAAEAALDVVKKKDIDEMKKIAAPVPVVQLIIDAVHVYLDKAPVPKDRSWKACQMMMGQDQFLNNLKNFEKKKIHPLTAKEIKNLLQNPMFNLEAAAKASQALSGLCEWVQNIDVFYDVYLEVEPKERALDNARSELAAAQDKLRVLQEKINALEEKLAVIKAEFDEAKQEKDRCQAAADKTAFTIDLANRLVNGLASEGVRWRDSIDQLNKQVVTLPGDVLLLCCFLSYVGCFTRRYRMELQEKMWIPTFKKTKPAIPYNDQIDTLSLIVDEALIASWNNEGLPTDRMSAENAAILINSSRWPLMIDPQLQGIKWIKQRYGSKLIVLRPTGRYLDEIERAVSNGDVLLLENIDEALDAVLDPLLGRQLIKKGTVLKIGDREVDFNPNFRLILQTKLANPHYKPEMQAQTTLINFTVTRDGLEEQLLGEVVKVERPDLEQQRSHLTQQQNEFKIMLKELEDDLLGRLSAAGENVLEDVELVESLEKTKSTAASISLQVEHSKKTAIEIDLARENYRSTAERASILYFILNDLYKINPIYQFSLKSFTVVFKNAILNTPASETLPMRVVNLIESITFAVFMYTSRALFEKDKLILMAQIAIQVLLQAKEIKQEELDFLLRFPYMPNLTSPLDFLTNNGWGGIKALTQMEEFANLDKDIEGSAKRWKKFIEAECPEREKLPGEWKNKSALQRLCIMRCLRPDRMTYEVRAFIEEKLGTKYVEARTVDFSKSFEESSSSTPIFFVLSPGVDPLKDVEAMGKKLGFTTDRRNFHNVSLGQGQEVVAEDAIDVASVEGAWVILQNVHLVAKWLPTLEKKMEAATEHANPNYRLFISAEPAASAEYHIIPQGILESAIKITNEPPSGMLANVHKALDNFNQDTLEMCSKETEFKAILFALCYFHAVVAERRKFGPQGWNRVYPFNVGDLTISVNVLYNYLEANNKIPWEDLRYLFGEIMYGGHITDDWDRRLCSTYLEEFMQPDLVDGELFFCPGFMAPPNIDYNGYHQYIDDNLPAESPTLYYLHPNAEIGFLTTVSEQLFKTIFELQPRDAGSGGGVSISREDIVKGLIEDFIDKVPEEFNIAELNARVEEKSPFIIVAIQEADRMNILMREVRRSLRELNLGLKGELTITPDMEVLEGKLFFDHVPDSWTKRAYPSMLGLQSWFADVQLRLRELEQWTGDFQLPPSVWLAGFFNPQSFLTAIMQETARKRGFALDNMRLSCDVTRKWKDDFTAPPREGAYVNGLFMEGARWDTDNGTIANARLKELYPAMPVIFIKAITQDKVETKGIYNCPVYRTKMRGPTFVWTFDLKSKEKPAKWTLGGVCLLLQV